MMMMMMRWVSSSLGLSLLESGRDDEDDDDEVGLFFTGSESTIVL